MSYDYLFKCIIVGDSGVGKSCILMRFIENRFQYIHELTIGVEFGAQIIKVEDKNIKIQIWDTAGQESFKSITRIYYKGCAIALVVFDLTLRKTFQNITKWLQAVNYECGKNVVFIIVGNKSDLIEKRQVTPQEIQKYVTKHNLMYIETSAKIDSREINNIFTKASEKVIEGVNSGNIEVNESNGIRLGCKFPKEYKKKRTCCDDDIVEPNCCTIF